MEMMTVAMNQTRYFATALAKNSAVTMAADAFPSNRFVMASKIVLMAKMKIIVQPHPT